MGSEKRIQLSNVELLSALIYERTIKGDPLKRSDIPKILSGEIVPETEPFNGVKFNYEGTSKEDEEEVLHDISTLYGIGSINQKRIEDEMIYVATESGEMYLEKYRDVLKEYPFVEEAIDSFNAPGTIFAR